MDRTIVLLFFTGFLAAVVCKPTSEDVLISELKRILQDRNIDTGLDNLERAAGDATEATDATDDDKEEELKEEAIDKELAEEAKKTEEPPENTEGTEGGEGTEEVGGETEGGEEAQPPSVQAMLHKGWDMLDEMQRVSVALNLENRPISNNKSPRDALQDVLVEIFEFDGMADKVIHDLLQRLSPSTDMCSQMFSDGEVKTLERVTNCFIMRFTQVLSLVEKLNRVTSISEIEGEDLIRLTTLERDLFQVSYEVFRILKQEDPSVSLPDIIGDKQAALVAMQEGDAKIAGSLASSEGGQESTSNPDDGETGTSDEGTDTGPSQGPGSADTSGPEGDQGKQEGDNKDPTNKPSKKSLREDLLARLERRLEELIEGKNER